MPEENINNLETQEETNTKKHKKITLKKRYFFSIIVIALAIIVYGFIMNAKKYESTDDAYIETHTVSVAPKVSGQVIKMLVKDNQKVKEGDLIAVIDPVDYEARLSEISAKYEAKLLKQKNAKANYKATNSEIELAKRNLDRYTKLYETGAVSKLDYDNAKTKYDNAQANLTEAQQDLLSKEGARVADADLKQLGAQKRQAALALSYTKIYAPQDGTVTNKSIEKGAYVQTGQPLCVIVPDQVWVVANFKENQLRHMKIGQNVDIKVDTYPDKIFKGKVDSFQTISGAKSSMFPPENAVGSFVKIVQRIPVKIVFTEKIDPNEYNIFTGMSVEPKVKVQD